jgi:RNA polymerase sigma factor (sigma-70 family)
VTTARREAMRVLRRSGRERPVVEDTVLDRPDEGPPVDTALLTNERDRALWQAFERLNDKCRQLLQIAVNEPKAYDEISAALGMPIGSIGPTRRRCLTQLRALLEGTVLAEPDGPR